MCGIFCVVQYNDIVVGFKNIYDTLKKYFVYRTGTIEAGGGAASEPTFTVLETPDETLHNEIQETESRDQP